VEYPVFHHLRQFFPNYYRTFSGEFEDKLERVPMLYGQQAIKTTHLAKSTLYNTLQFSCGDEGLWEDLTTGERKKASCYVLTKRLSSFRFFSRLKFTIFNHKL
jgi:hypothetical protein